MGNLPPSSAPPPLFMPPPMMTPMGMGGAISTPPLPPITNMSPLSMGKRPSFDAQNSVAPPKPVEPAKQPPIPSKAPPQPAVAPKKPSEKPKSAGSSTKGPGLFSRLMPKFLLPGNQVHLPGDSDASIYYDEDKKRWVDKNAGAEDEDSLANSAPPSGGPGGLGGPGGPPPPMMPPGGGNKFSGGIGKRRGAQVLNPFKNSLSNPALSANLPPPGELFAPVAPISVTPEESAGPSGQGGPGAPPAVAPGATTPEGGPVFFNPSNYGNGPPTTRRSKY